MSRTYRNRLLVAELVEQTGGNRTNPAAIAARCNRLQVIRSKKVYRRHPKHRSRV